MKTIEVHRCSGGLFFVPKSLTKGAAMNRLKERIKADYVIAAGDTSFDVSMLLNADRGYTTIEIKKELKKNDSIVGFKTPIKNEILKRVLEEVSA